MLDAVAAVAWPVSFGHCLENVQANAVGAIADGVKRQLESSFVALDSHGAQFAWIVREDARRGRIITIGFEQRRRARTQSAVADGLQRAGLQPWIPIAALCAPILQLIERGIERQPLRDARGEFAVLLQLLINLKIFPCRIVLHGSDTVARDIRQHDFNSPPPLFR